MSRSLLLAGIAALSGGLVLAAAQERPRTVRQTQPQERKAEVVLDSDDVVRVRTRVVFLDALVKDRRTNEPVRDLSPENFRVLDEGKPRTLSYFTREGDSRRPLALLLFVDLWSLYGKSYLRDPDVLARLVSALKKLAPEDEVAVMTTWVVEQNDGTGTPVPIVRMIGDFTRDRSKTTATLLSIPELIREQERLLEEMAAKRTREAGDLRLDIIWRLSYIADEVVPLAGRFPVSQFVVVGVTDDLFDLKKGEREGVTERALRAGITFNGLVFNKSFGARLFFGTFNKLFMSTRGLSIHAADSLAEQTGGEVAHVGRPDDLAVGLERFISSLMARYNLGFALDEREPDDGRMHRLSVKVAARDGKRRERKLLVRARRGYYMSEIKRGTPAKQ